MLCFAIHIMYLCKHVLKKETFKYQINKLAITKPCHIILLYASSK